jgi:2-dehydro-3-deoxygalactonokinase
VLGDLPAESVSEWLSGLLIGAEVATLREGTTQVTLVGGELLCRRYHQAFADTGIQAREIAGDTALQQGIRSILDARR